MGSCGIGCVEGLRRQNGIVIRDWIRIRVRIRDELEGKKM